MVKHSPPRESTDDKTRQNWIDKAIQDARDRGVFDNLDGEGRPIDWADESLIDEEWLMAFRIMREHGFAPQWIELRKEIDLELGKARSTVKRAWRWRNERLAGASETQRRHIEAEWRRARTEFAEKVSELNAKTADFNLIVPLVQLQKFQIDFDTELERLGIDS